MSPEGGDLVSGSTVDRTWCVNMCSSTPVSDLVDFTSAVMKKTAGLDIACTVFSKSLAILLLDLCVCVHVCVLKCHFGAA